MYPINAMVIGLSLMAASACWADPPEYLQYEGRYSDVSFPGGVRKVTEQSIKVFQPKRQMGAGSRGPEGRILIEGGPKPLEFKIKNAYQSPAQLIYLGVRGDCSLVLITDGPPVATGQEQNIQKDSIILYSNREGARNASGKFTVLANPRIRK